MNAAALLDMARQLVCQDRHSDYGDANVDFDRTCGMFYQMTKKSLSAEQGILFMVCVKLSRESFKHKEDNILDCCGYLALYNEIIERKHHAKEEVSKADEHLANLHHVNMEEHEERVAEELRDRREEDLYPEAANPPTEDNEGDPISF